VMTPRSDGQWFWCAHCAHVVIPEQPSYQCSCAKCVALARPLLNRAN
jgi:Zn finger protein HypA/HybF involved in hydrogenase expression